MKRNKVFCRDCNYCIGLTCYYKAPKGFRKSYMSGYKIRNSNPEFACCQENKDGECKYYTCKWWKFWRRK